MKRTLVILTFVVVCSLNAAPARPPQAAGSAQTYDSLVVMPTPIESPSPQYPEVARKKGVQGTIWLEVQVSAEGKVTNVRVAKNKTGSKEIEQAAISTARQWRFKPATKDDKPVSVWVTIPFAFKLDSAKTKGK